MTNKTVIFWLLYAISCFLLIFAAIQFWQAHDYLSAFLFAGFAVICFYLSGKTQRKSIQDAEKIIHSILQKDFSLSHEAHDHHSLKKMVINLYQNAQKENIKMVSYKIIYENILNKMEIGVAILEQKKDTSEWRVFYTNPTFLSLLKIPKYEYWHWYAEKIPVFYDLVLKTAYKDSQEFYEISILQSQKQTYSVRTSRIDLPNSSFFTISIESIQKIIDKKEKQAWNNLMKVISHELLNTLTPLNSLLQNLQYISQQNEFSTDDREEIKDSLRILNGKSQQLLHFIDNYRQVAELPKPKFGDVNLKNCLEKIVLFYETKMKSRNIGISINVQDMVIQADEKMLERAFINLLLNAIYAVEETEEKTITITSLKQQNRLIIRFTDTGTGIPDEIQSKIFLPFFTTRNQGSGIGLTLTKSIIEAHGGYLTHKNLEKGCAFEIWWI